MIERLGTVAASAMVIAASFVPATPTLAASGDLDPTFSGDGRVFVGTASSRADSITTSANRVYVSGRQDDRLFVARLTRTGNRDTTFSEDGVTYLPEPRGRFAFTALAVDGMHRAVLVAQSDKVTVVTRLTASGRRDTSFSGDGRRTLPGGAPWRSFGPKVAIDSQGRSVIAAMIDTGRADNVVRIWRLMPGGQLDGSWSDNGLRTVDAGVEDWMDALAVDQQDRVLLGSDLANISSPARIYRFNSDGKLDRNFGTEGVARFRLGQGNTYPTAIGIDGSGSITVAASVVVPVGGIFGAVRFSDDGVLDTSYGDNGVVRSECRACEPYVASVADDRVAIVVQPDAEYEQPQGTLRVAEVTSSGDGLTVRRIDPFPQTRRESAAAIAIAGPHVLMAGAANDRAFVARLA